MPWTKKQQKLAQAVAHGFKPSGKAKGFDKDFAEQVIEESPDQKKRRKKAEEKLGPGTRIAPK